MLSKHGGKWGGVEDESYSRTAFLGGLAKTYVFLLLPLVLAPR